MSRSRSTRTPATVLLGAGLAAAFGAAAQEPAAPAPEAPAADAAAMPPENPPAQDQSAPAPAATSGFDYGLKLKLAGLAEGPRDLGFSGRLDDTQEATLEVNPEIHYRGGPNFAAYLRLQGFVASDEVVLTDNNDQPQRTEGFVGLRELWFEYGGLTSYPGEVLRIGRQRLRQDDAMWFDRDIEALRWIFDTTLLQSDIGVAQAFDAYRTNDYELPTELDERLYVFGSVSGEWKPGHRLGLRVAHADDSGEQARVGERVDSTSKLQGGQLSWIALRAENGFYDFRRFPRVAYWAESTFLVGDEHTAEVAEVPADPAADPQPALTVSGETERDVKAWAADLGLRWKVSPSFPLQIGLAYAVGGGSGDAEESEQFRQTGLQSNRSRFTGTRTLIPRFNEALRAELSNLSAIGGFASLQFERYDLSLVAQAFRRVDDDEPVITDGIGVQPAAENHDLGRGYDLVATRYFGPVKDEADPEGDIQTSLRLRASWFDPGDAYAADVPDDAYRVVLEATLQF